KRKILAGVLAVSVAAIAGPAMALNGGDMAQSLTSQTSSIGVFIGVASFVIGVAIALMGLAKFRAHTQNKNDPSNSIGSALMLVFVGACFVAIPEVLGVGVSTLFGDSARTTD